MKTQSIIKSISILFFLSIYLVTTAQENATFIGVWRSGKTPQVLFPMGDAGDYSINKRAATKKRYPMIADIEISTRNKGEHTWSVWERKKVGALLQVGNWKEIMSDVKRLGKQGYKIVDIEPYYAKYNNGWSYLAIFHKSATPTLAYRLNSWGQVASKAGQLVKKGYCLTDVEIEGSGKNRRYIGIWKKTKQANYIWEAPSWKDFTKKWEEFGKKNFRLIDIETFVSNGKRHYTGTWVNGKDGYYLWNIKGYSNFAKKFAELKKKGLRLVDMEVIY